VTSDHGESLGDHGLSFHGAALYRELVHVPLIISWPGRVPDGVRVAEPISNTEIAATVLSLIGASDHSFPGPSLRSWWTGSAYDESPSAISELPQTNTIVAADRKMQGKIPVATDGWMLSVVSPDWHLIIHQKDGAQIYKWKDDPGELKNLAETPEGRAAIVSLEPLLAR
jgi:arylsulfatase A-like enzyme